MLSLTEQLSLIYWQSHFPICKHKVEKNKYRASNCCDFLSPQFSNSTLSKLTAFFNTDRDILPFENIEWKRTNTELLTAVSFCHHSFRIGLSPNEQLSLINWQRHFPICKHGVEKDNYIANCSDFLSSQFSNRNFLFILKALLCYQIMWSLLLLNAGDNRSN